MKVVIDIPKTPKNDKQRWALVNGTPYEDISHGEWIPCSEMLPEEIGDYLVTENISDIALAVYVSSFGHIRTGELCFYYEDEDGRAIKNDGIVAWMPLPKPYKKEGEAE